MGSLIWTRFEGTANDYLAAVMIEGTGGRWRYEVRRARITRGAARLGGAYLRRVVDGFRLLVRGDDGQLILDRDFRMQRDAKRHAFTLEMARRERAEQVDR